ncbi:hypothetical protein MARINOS108_120004 [Marinoscillum sp. 108]|nr:hypothetical protein MARINOS108_120004 [Marinoscillum sp. 108]
MLKTVIPAQAGISSGQEFSGSLSGIVLLFDGAQSDNAQLRATISELGITMQKSA